MIKQGNKTYDWVIASGLEMVQDSIYFCDTAAHTLAVHHNDAASAIFKAASEAFTAEESLLLAASAKITLPVIPPWELPHENYDHPAPDLMEAHYLMSSSQALQLVEKLIQVHTCFYNDIKATHPIDETLNLVQQCLAQCVSCLRNVQAQKGDLPEVSARDPLSDLDAAVAQS